MKNKIKKHLIDKHGDPDSFDFLDKYLELVTNPKNINENVYSEMHHILTRSQFPDFIKSKWNKVFLSYDDHVKAHEYLFYAFNLRTYQRPLNYMKPQSVKDHQQLKNAAKKGWETLKNNPEKYKEFCEKRSNHMKSLSSEEQSRRSKMGWDKPGAHEKRSQISKDMWTEEMRKKQSKSLKEFHKNNPEFSSKISQKCWDSKTKEQRENFSKKMDEVNKDENKRNKASKSLIEHNKNLSDEERKRIREIRTIAAKQPEKRKKISKTLKEKWKNENFRTRMKLRNKAYFKTFYVLISPENEKFIRNIKYDLLREFNFSIGVFHDFLNTGKTVKHENKRNSKQIKKTIGWKFYSENK